MKQLLSLMLVVVLVVMTGCGGKGRRLGFDPTFSYNLIETPSDWPNEKKDWPKDDPDLALRQQQVYEKHGAPDYFWVKWRKDGRIVTDAELTQRMWGQSKSAGGYMKKTAPDMAWVYLEDGLVFTFPKSGVKEEELNDIIRVVADNGDPSDVKESRDVNGKDILLLTYFDEGRVYTFTEGKKTRDEVIQAMPGMMMRK